MRFEWEKVHDLDALRSRYCRLYIDPKDPTKRICIQSSGQLHAKVGGKWIAIDSFNHQFPEGKEFKSKASRHFIMDLPDLGGRVELEGNVVFVRDSDNVSVFKYTSPAVIEKNKEAFITSLDVDGFETKIPSPDLESVEFEVEGNKLYLKMPSTLKSKYPLRVFDDTDTSSVNNKDTFLTEAQPTTNKGSETFANVGQGAVEANQNRMLIHYTLVSDPGGTPTAVSNFIYVSARTGTPTNDAHVLTQTGWVEGEATWNIYKTGSNWASAGGDFNGTAIDSTVVPAATNYQEWVLMGAGSDVPLTLNWEDELHLLIKHHTETGANSYATYNTKEAGSNVPYLQITYTPAGWANIAKVCGVTATDLAKVNGIAVADIAKINGVAV